MCETEGELLAGPPAAAVDVDLGPGNPGLGQLAGAPEPRRP